MDLSNHFSIPNLFDQLGLPSDQKAISQFINRHKLPADQKLEEAGFWNNSQASFLKQAIAEDSDWAEIVDMLNRELR